MTEADLLQVRGVGKTLAAEISKQFGLASK